MTSSNTLVLQYSCFVELIVPCLLCDRCLDVYALEYISEVLHQLQDEDCSFDLECFVSMLSPSC